MKQIFFILLMIFCMNLEHTDAQTGKPLSVGIFVYPNVEILDFTGPSEVFASTEGFKPFLVAFKKEPLLSQGFITVTPQYSIDDCPPTDILIFPGGNSASVSGEKKLIDWIQERSKTTRIMMSVCTGAHLLSKAGLLNGMEVTTWHGAIAGLQEATPAATVLSNIRFVDNGHIITTAGVSAGIDGSLHVVSRIKGESVAHATAHYMEYDKWEPENGKVHETDFMKTVRAEGFEAARKKYPPVEGSLQPRFYQGEMINFALELAETKPAAGEAILQYLLKNSTPTPALYSAIGAVNKKLGKYVPVENRVFMKKLTDGEIEWAQQTWKEVKQHYPEWVLFTEDQANSAAYQLVGLQPESAIALLKWSTELFPASANLWDSLAEFYEMSGKHALAMAASEQCLAKVPASGADQDTQALLTKISKERIARMKAKQ